MDRLCYLLHYYPKKNQPDNISMNGSTGLTHTPIRQRNKKTQFGSLCGGENKNNQQKPILYQHIWDVNICVHTSCRGRTNAKNQFCILFLSSSVLLFEDSIDVVIILLSVSTSLSSSALLIVSVDRLLL